MAINYNKVISDLSFSQASIINKLGKRKNDIDRYFYITSVFAKNEPISSNEEFKETYKTFYVMRTAGLSQQHFDKYFELLDSRVNNLETILNELYEIKTLKQLNSLQFSFATKLLHTLDNSLPIYDNQVKKTLGLPDVYNIQDSPYKKTKKLLAYYANLKMIYRQLLAEARIKKLIDDIKKYFGWTANQINDVKILDFVLWVHSQK